MTGRDDETHGLPPIPVPRVSGRSVSGGVPTVGRRPARPVRRPRNALGPFVPELNPMPPDVLPLPPDPRPTARGLDEWDPSCSDPDGSGLEPDPGRSGLEPDPGRSGLEPDPGRSGLEPDPGRSGLEPHPGRSDI